MEQPLDEALVLSVFPPETPAEEIAEIVYERPYLAVPDGWTGNAVTFDDDGNIISEYVYSEDTGNVGANGSGSCIARSNVQLFYVFALCNFPSKGVFSAARS